jgi:hypothetical protein
MALKRRANPHPSPTISAFSFRISRSTWPLLAKADCQPQNVVPATERNFSFLGRIGEFSVHQRAG